MTIHQRLERLTEPREALTQTAEPMVAENRDRDKRQAEIMEGVTGLGHIAEIYGRPMQRLGGN